MPSPGARRVRGARQRGALLAAPFTDEAVRRVLASGALYGEVEKALIAAGGVLFVLWTVSYFVVLGCGQTPGNRVMQIRVVGSDGGTLRRRTAALRLAALAVAAIPFFAGSIPILFDRHRRAFQDCVARSVVVCAP